MRQVDSGHIGTGLDDDVLLAVSLIMLPSPTGLWHSMVRAMLVCVVVLVAVPAAVADDVGTEAVGDRAAGSADSGFVLGELSVLVTLGLGSTTTDAEAAELLRVPHLVDGAEFDLDTTTDTEVSRLRALLKVRVGRAAAQVDEAERTLDSSAEARDEARGVRNAARDEVDRLDRAFSAIAIHGFVGSANREFASLGEGGTALDAASEATRASVTASEVKANLVVAQESLALADGALEVARTELGSAWRHTNELRLELAEQEEAVVRHDARAVSHRAVGDMADAAAARRSDTVALTSVAGTFQVAVDRELIIDLLIADARADGVNFAGGSFRTVEEQIALRLAHCGGPLPPSAAPSPVPPTGATVEEGPVADGDNVERESDDAPATIVWTVETWQNYVIYEVPAGSCSPPTALPGRSQHQVALAIDFTQDDELLTPSHSGFAWLVEHGAEYGLINLPTEAWHWSVNGQ